MFQQNLFKNYKYQIVVLENILLYALFVLNVDNKNIIVYVLLLKVTSNNIIANECWH